MANIFALYTLAALNLGHLYITPAWDLLLNQISAIEGYRKAAVKY